jgi:molecular chaperone HtpG
MEKTRTIIGKDVIESLTLGMYEDCRFINREYIQNAADQIDKAIREGLISKEEGAIHIDINRQQKCISIEDNATGIEQSKVSDILKNIAQSTKERGVDKGFRGIGRLGGLGYCETLIFETTFKGKLLKQQ